MSEWEEFAAYASMIKRAKLEERERIVKAFMNKVIALRYAHDGRAKDIEAQVDRPEYCEFVIRDIIKESEDGK